MIKTGAELAAKAVEVATKHKTLYVMCAFGAPMNNVNKARYIREDPYNMQTVRAKMINSASADTFGFDCVNLIKGLLWGWCGDKSKTYGGAVYCSNGVPDVDANCMLNLCKDISTDFSQIEVGEAVGMQGHIGIYIGNGLAVESTPAWKNCVQITAVGNIGAKAGYPTRKWVRHGKLPYISYGESKHTSSSVTGEYSSVNGVYKSLGTAAQRNKPTLQGTTVSKRCVKGGYYPAERLYAADSNGQKWFKHWGKELYSALTDTDGSQLFEFVGNCQKGEARENVNFRESPSLSGRKIKLLNKGTPLYLTGKRQKSGGITWVECVADERIGWCDQQWIE